MYPANEIHLHLDHVCAAHREVLAAVGYAFRPRHPGHQPAPSAKRSTEAVSTPGQRMKASATRPEPISFNPRDYSQGKKIKLKDAFEAVWALLIYRFID